MATKSAQQFAPVGVSSIGKFVAKAMKTYGVETNENRAIPSFEDGLKPVQRRIAWAAHQSARGYVKTARLNGNVMGALHPHGSASIAGAVVTIVNAPVPFLYGDGNWGDLISPAAADRYTNVKLSVYGGQFLNKDYLPVTPMAPNYDDRELEPIYLPALLPNVLMNDSMGIGLGVTTKIPCFTPPSIIKILLRLIDKEELTTADYVRTLQLFEPWGGTMVKSPRNKEMMVQLLETGKGSIEWQSPVEFDNPGKRYTIRRFAPGVNVEKVIEQINALPLVDKVYSGKGLSYEVQVKKSANYAEVEDIGKKITAMFRTRQSYSIYVSERTPVGTDGKYDVSFHSLSVPDLLIKWLSFRVRLEVSSLTYRIGKCEELIKRLHLLIRACDHLDVIFKALRTNNPDDAIAKGMKITLEEAKIILELRVRQLSALDQKVLKRKLAEANAVLADLKAQLKRPSRSVKTHFEQCLQAFECNDKRHAGCDQWWMKPLAASPDAEPEAQSVE